MQSLCFPINTVDLFGETFPAVLQKSPHGHLHSQCLHLCLFVLPIIRLPLDSTIHLLAPADYDLMYIHLSPLPAVKV